MSGSRRFIAGFLVMVLITMLLCGCSKNNMTISYGESTENSIAIDYETSYKESEVANLIEDEWKRIEISEQESLMTLSEYYTDIFSIDEGKKTYNMDIYADNQYIYSLDSFYYQDDETEEYYSKYYLSKFDIDKKDVSVTEYDIPYEGTLSNLYTANGRVYATLQVDNEAGHITEYCVVELLQDGTIQKKTDVADILENRGWMPKFYYVSYTKLFYESVSKNTYIISESKDCMIVADENGNELFEYEGLSDDKLYLISLFTYSDDGRAIFITAENGSENILTFNGIRTEILFSDKMGEEYSHYRKVVDTHGNILFIGGTNSDSVYSWNILDGIQEKLYKISSAYAAYSNEIQAFSRNQKGELLILTGNNLKVFSRDKMMDEVEITIKPQVTLDQYFVLKVKKYEESHPGVTFAILDETEWASRDIELNKLYTDLLKGEGPDLILTDDSQANVLVKSGCLYDMSDTLKGDVTEKLIPAVKNGGYINGSKYLMPLMPEIRALFVDKKYCRDGVMTISNILDVIEKRENDGNPFKRITASMFYENPLNMFCLSYSDSEFVDIYKRTCNFETQNFIRLLNVCKRYNDKSISESIEFCSADECYKMIREDEALFYFENSGLSLPRYSAVMASLGENEYVTIGYPSVCGNDIRISFVRYIAINKNFMEKETDKKKVIEDFLNCLYMPEYNNESMSSLVPVRLDAFEGKILMAGDYDYLTSPALKLDDRTYTSIAAKRDGSTYVDDYLELLKKYDNLFYVDTDEAVIREIVFEETEPFFNGAKTAEETARTIQNRVSLYLMENG